MNKIGVLAISMLLATSAVAYKSAQINSTATNPEIEAVVAKYIDDNPEAIFQALMKYQEIKKKEAIDATRDKAYSMRNDLFFKSGDPTIGSADAPITIVEFMDYQCGYCKLMDPPLKELVQNNPEQYRLVIKPLPYLGDHSKTAAEVAMAATKASKFKVVHQQLLALKRPYTKEDITSILAANGVKLKAEDFALKVEEATTLAQALSVSATPSFFIYNKNQKKVSVIQGAMPAEAFKSKIKEMTK
jgi:protein-disulfide isomerase